MPRVAASQSLNPGSLAQFVGYHFSQGSSGIKAKVACRVEPGDSVDPKARSQTQCTASRVKF
jgi:hypothetical protein